MSATVVHRAPLPPGPVYACDVSGCGAFATVCWRVVEVDEPSDVAWSTASSGGPLRLTCGTHTKKRRTL